MRSLVLRVAVFAIPIICFVTVGMGLSLFFKTDGPNAAATAIVGVWAFAVVVGPEILRGSVDVHESRFRAGIAAAIITEYLVLVGLVAFHKLGPEELPPIAKEMVASFTANIGVVIATYFGASAVVEITKIRSARSRTEQVAGSSPPEAT
jgi:hypothetical protein